MPISNWIQTRIKQIASLSQSGGGGNSAAKIDSNKEYSCLAKLLANCTTEEDKKFIKGKMDEYVANAKKHHFEHSDGTSYDEVYDSTNNRMYVGYDQKGNLEHINTTVVRNNCEYPEETIKFDKNGNVSDIKKR